MLLSIQWLREYVPYDGSAQTLSDKLTMLGLEVENIHRPFAGIQGVVVGHVLECVPHPEADRLSVCKVDAGFGEALDIVCGAPNVATGQKVAFAPVGAKLPGGLEIKKAKLRGRSSHGMICSERELELSDAHSGIIVLPPGFAVGARLIDALKVDEEVLEINVTPNRADCLSVTGLAREVALAFGLPFSVPKVELAEEGEDASFSLYIDVPDPELCPLYQGRILEGARIELSPLRLRCRLHAMGLRAVSNIVDATNYILMEWGQPLHAFDLNKVEGGRITVSPARKGERIQTLDGQERLLEGGDLLIRDAVKPIGLAGVMGGLNSEITTDTSCIFLESAVFHPAIIRRTARRLGIQSEASYRFERGVDQEANSIAMNRACALMAELAGARTLPGVCRKESKPWKSPQIRFRPRRAATLLGLSQEKHFDRDFCRTTMIGLGCVVEEKNVEEWIVLAPSRRRDITREVDVIEELGRVYGLDAIAPELPKVERSLDIPLESKYAFWSRIKTWAAGLGLNEAINYSFVGHVDLDRLRLPAEERVSIMNPLSGEQDVLRTAVIPGLLQNLRYNIAQGTPDVALFETTHIFTADATSETTVLERGRLGILLHGRRFDSAWPHPGEAADYLDIKGLVEHLCASFHLPPPRCKTSREWEYLSPCVRVSLGEEYFGCVGRIVPELADHFHARKAVWTAEFDLDLLQRLHHAATVRFFPLPTYPPVRRDITLIGGSVTVDAVLEHIRTMSLPWLEDVHLLDLFEQEENHMRNLTFRLSFRDVSRTLKDAEVDKEREKVALSLKKAFGVQI